jgi:CHAD domain-containing protein
MSSARTAVGSAIAAVAVGATARKLAQDRAARREAARREFRVHDGESGAEAVGRVTTGQLDRAIDDLGDAGDGFGKAVHDARKAFKRARAAIRLGRRAIGKPAYARENAALRDAGRSLASARDAEVVVETLDELTERYREQLPPNAFAGLRAALVAEGRTAQERLRIGPVVPALIVQLGLIRDRIGAWPADGADDGKPLRAGFRRIYRRGRKALRNAEKQPDAETLHELRKRAKDLWHAAQIMRPAKPKRLRKVAKRAHRLADALGDDHDLAVLRDAATDRPEALREGEDLLLRAVVRERQDELRREAFERARRLYSSKSGAL